MASNLETTRKGYELFKQGDISTLVKDIVDDTCTWITPGPRDKLPWAGNFKGKRGIADFFARVAQNLDITKFEPREIIEQGDTVVVIGTSSPGKGNRQNHKGRLGPHFQIQSGKDRVLPGI